MAPFDHDPKNSDPPPHRDPAASDPFDALFEPPSGNSSAESGDFTKLFGKPPTPEPLPGIGEAKPPKAGPVAEPVEGAVPEPAALSPAISAQRLPVPTSREVELGKPGSFTEFFASPVVSPVTETSSDASPESPPIAPNSELPSPVQPPRGASEFTMLFGSSARKPAGEVVAAPLIESPSAHNAAPEPKQLPGSFTQMFGATARPPAQSPTRTPATPETQAVPKSASPEELASIFDFPLRDSSSDQEMTPKPLSGDFTKMFSPSPAVPGPPVTAPDAKDAGAFTKLFQTPSSSTETTEPQHSDGLFKLSGTKVAEPTAGSFAGIFGRDASSQADRDNLGKPASNPPPGSGRPFSGLEEASSPEEQQRTGWPSEARSPLAGGAPSDGATRIFKPAVSPGAPPSPAIPAGPSAFTKVISGSQVREAMRQAEQQAPSSPAPPTPPMPQFFSPSAMPPAAVPMPNVAPPGMSMPGAPHPPMPHMPQMQMPYQQIPLPQIQLPQMPQPPMPQPPAGPAAPAKVNWMPLIIGLNVFFVIVVLLIMIFALRK